MPSTLSKWDLIRQEPYRVLFPLAIYAGVSGAFHWITFGLGSGKWNVMLHVGLQVPAYMGLFAAGFLATAVPRFTGTESASRREAAWLMLLSVAVVGAPAAQSWAVTAGTFLVFLGFLAMFLGSRMRRAKQMPPGVFPWVATGLGYAAVGCMSYIAGAAGGLPWLAQGFMMALILATAPLVGHRILEHAPGQGRRIPFLPTALALTASFVLESWTPAAWSGPWVTRLAYGLRGATLAIVFARSGLLALPGRKIPHAMLFWIALCATALGPLAVAAFPAHRAGLLHITLIGGFSLMMLMVATRVTLVHGGAKALVEAPYLPATVYGGLVFLAAILRAAAEFIPSAYGPLLAAAASAWCLAQILFVIYPGRKLLVGPGH